MTRLTTHRMSAKWIICVVLISIAYLTQEGFADEEENSKANETTGLVIAEENLDPNEYRFHEESQKFQKIGTTDPCGDNMRFFAVPNDNRKGQCDCDYYECSRALLYHKKLDVCYWAFSRGPCDEGEWYSFGEGMKPICEKNICPESPAVSSMNYYFKRSEDGKCYEAGTQGYCQYESEQLVIYPGEPVPACRNYTLCSPLSIPPQQICIQGSRRHHEGFCKF